jgi:hypothetical protein
MRTHSLITGILVTPALTGYSLAAQGPSKGKGLAETQIRPEGMSEMIYVKDFELDTADMEHDQGILKEGGPLKGEGSWKRTALARLGVSSPVYQARQEEWW